MPINDIFEQRVITRLVRRNIEEEAQRIDGGEARGFSGATIAPLVGENSDVVKIRISDVQPFGLGQFKAPDATPPLFKAQPVLRETEIELAYLEEMERFSPREWRRLTANDDAIQRGAMLDLVTRLRIMQVRNTQLTEWMRWQAFKGVLVINYSTGGQITVDYGFTSDHLPTALTLWTDVTNSDPVADLNAWGIVGSDEAGQYYRRVHLNTITWNVIVRNVKLRSYLSQLGRSIMLPTEEDLRTLLRDGTGNFIRVDSGYLPVGATNRRLTKFLPDYRVLFTTEYVLNGERIADVADGLVAVGGGPNEAPRFVQGMQSEIMSNPYSKIVFRRQASARMVRLYQPEAFLYAAVG